jgi:protein phosphatase
MQVNTVPGAVPLFLLAATVILVGVVGLIAHLRKEPNESELADEGPRELNVYKQYECPITRSLIDRFGQMETMLAETMSGQKVEADWAAHTKLKTVAENEAKKGEGPAALQARCRSLLFLAEAYHRSRAKEETFKPSW